MDFCLVKPQRKKMNRITVAKGDGIGPEIMDATLKILFAAGAKLEIDEIEVGEKVYLAAVVNRESAISPLYSSVSILAVPFSSLILTQRAHS